MDLKDLADKCTSMMQATNLKDYDLKRISVEIEVPSEVTEKYLMLFTEASNWREALLLFVRDYPPSGNTEENRHISSDTAKKSIFLSLCPITILGSNGLPRYSITTEEEKAEYHLAQHEQMLLSINGPYAAQALQLILNKWDTISELELTQFLSSQPHVSMPVAKSLTRAFYHYRQGDYEATAYMVAPRIESLARTLILLLNLPAYQVQRQKTP